MSLKEKLLDEMKIAMREKDNVRKDAIQMVRASILQYEKDNKVELDDEGVIDIITKEVKRYKDALPDYEKSGRQDLVDELNAKVAILMPYLPEQLTEDEVRAIVKAVVEETGATSMREMGKIMGAVMPKVKGRFDGRLLNNIVKEYLS
ncbi:MAG: GatB/YqeY domain-containing protein [Clostridia bacterium]|nr:GatB/YqeY domain-containing protein [Clostridia bacterium]